MWSGKILRNAHGSPGGGCASNCATYVEAERTWAPGALAPAAAFAAAVPSGRTATARASAASERLNLMGPPSCSGARLLQPDAGWMDRRHGRTEPRPVSRPDACLPVRTRFG